MQMRDSQLRLPRISYNNGKKKFVFCFEPKTEEEEKLIEQAREIEEEIQKRK